MTAIIVLTITLGGAVIAFGMLLGRIAQDHERIAQQDHANQILERIEELRTGTAESVTIYQPIDDWWASDTEMEAVCINGEWTDYEDRHFSGKTLLDALNQAAAAKRISQSPKL